MTQVRSDQGSINEVRQPHEIDMRRQHGSTIVGCLQSQLILGDIIVEVRRENFRSDIQGLRAVAVGLVVLYHGNLPGLSGGFVGVDVFYVISGFLITNHLAANLERSGRIRFGEFYARRARRLLPASFVVIALSIVGVALWLPPLQWKASLNDAVATAAYVPNIRFAQQSTNYLGETTPSVFQHYWSLGVEEQFYLVWPALLALGFIVCRGSTRSLTFLISGVSTVSFLACLHFTSSNQPYAFFLLPTRAWELGVGALLAIIQPNLTWRPRNLVIAAGSWIGLGGIIAVGITYDENTTFPGVAAAVPVIATALLIYFGQYGRSQPVARLLSSTPLVFIGTISYSLYLVHWPILVFVTQTGGTRSTLPLWGSLSLVALAIPAAYVLYRFVEQPTQHWNWLSDRRPRATLLVAIISSCVLIAFAVSSSWAVRYVPLNTPRSEPAQVLDRTPSFTDFVPSNLRPSLQEAAQDNPSVLENGCSAGYDSTDPTGCTYGPASAPTKVALFGDSHAAQWFPALQNFADRGEIQLHVITKPSCPSAEILKNLNGAPYQSCPTWRQNAISALQKNPPDLVLLGNYSHSDGLQWRGDEAANWAESVASTVRALSEKSDVFVIADTPHFPTWPAYCLSAHLADTRECTVQRLDALDSRFLVEESAAVKAAGGRYVNLNDFLCTEDACAPIVGNLLLYRDDNHITATTSLELSDALGAELGIS